MKPGELNAPVACTCNQCGVSFPSKAARRRHKQSGCVGSGALSQCGAAPENDDEHLNGRVHITPEVKARADAEWAAMDWRGRLPEGWSWPPAKEHIDMARDLQGQIAGFGENG